VTNPYEPPGAIETELFAPKSERIQSMANKSLLFGLLGLFCCGLIFGPIAINYANQAEAAIILDDSGATYGSTYKVGRVLGYAAIGLWALGFVVRVVGMLSH
jgi:sulfite exporter TauE/SafE